MPQYLNLIGIFEQVEEKLAIFFFLDAFSFSGIIIVHPINYLFEWNEFEASLWFFVGPIDDVVEIIHKIDFLVSTEFVVEVILCDKGKLFFKESAYGKFTIN